MSEAVLNALIGHGQRRLDDWGGRERMRVRLGGGRKERERKKGGEGEIQIYQVSSAQMHPQNYNLSTLTAL
jgi:hypothetical protein